MIYNLTRTNKEYNRVVVKTLGKYSLWERIQRNGVGSRKLIIVQKSKNLAQKQVLSSDIDYANIELRPNGIIVHYSIKYDRYAWIIPYYKLHIYNSTYYTIHADGEFIKLKKDKNYTSNKVFLNKLMDEKIDYLQLGYYDG